MLGALILLSSITSIFNNLVVVGDASAQPFEKVADNGYENPVPSVYANNPTEYSSYDNYEPADYGKVDDSSYNDGQANNFNNMDDQYSKYPTEEYKYQCQRGPFEGFFVISVEFCDIKIHDDKKDPKDTKFTCPDSGLVVDKKENCPIICPTGSALEGHFVKAGSDLTKVCNVDTPLQQTCGEGTDLSGVLVSDPTTDCDLTLESVDSEVCPTGTALVGVAVPDDGDPTTVPEVCNLSSLDKCISGDLAGAFVTDTDGNTVFDTIIPDTEEPICDLPEAEVEACAADTDLEGMIVADTDDNPNGQEEACEITLSDVELETCPTGTALVGVAVPDDGDPTTFPEVCNLSGLDKCISGDLEGAFVTDTDGNTVFDTIIPDTEEPICDLPEAEVEVCDEETQLAGIIVDDTNTIFDGLEAACNPFEICPTNTALAGVAVLDDRDPDTPLPTALCTLNGLERCPDGSIQAGHFVVGDGDLTTTQITDPEGAGFDSVLAGICNVRDDATATNQCLKCADLAALQGFSDTAIGQNGQIQASIDLIGENSADLNVFDVCDNINTAKTEFTNDVVNLPGGISAQETRIQNAFNLCIDNVLAAGGSLQENSLTTNIKSEAEIPSVNAEPQNANLTSLRENPNVKALLQNPDLNSMLENPDVNALLKDPDVNALLKDPDVNALLKDPEVNAQLETQK